MKAAWNSQYTLRLLVAVVTGAAAWWLVHHTEWVQTQEPVPLSEEMRQDGTVVARHLLQKLGMQTRVADNLQSLPPTTGTLVLSTGFWNLVVGSDERLHQWVRAGGHLVVDEHLLEELPTGDWFKPRLKQRDRRAEIAEAQTADWCQVLRAQPAAQAPASWSDEAGFVSCLASLQALRPISSAMWQLAREDGSIAAQRVALGQGRITAVAAGFNFNWQGTRSVAVEGFEQNHLRNFSNRGLLEGDNAALLAALVDTRAGGEVWFVTRVHRPPLPLWLWQVAAPALLLAGVALALALWRGGVRFGPLQAEPPPVRRSIAAQVQGLADFLFTRQPLALHTSAVRALREAAAPRIHGWARLTPAARTAALARATGLPAAQLEAAQEGHIARSAAAWSDTLALLEMARRALLRAGKAQRPAPERPSPQRPSPQRSSSPNLEDAARPGAASAPNTRPRSPE